MKTKRSNITNCTKDNNKNLKYNSYKNNKICNFKSDSLRKLYPKNKLSNPSLTIEYKKYEPKKMTKSIGSKPSYNKKENHLINTSNKKINN